VIRESIQHKGCTIRDYVWDAGKSGEFAKRLKVYGKEDEACPRCKDEIKRTVVAGRGTFFCTRCQR
jgi:formamidopyrimidine-DNA glycosylase